MILEDEIIQLRALEPKDIEKLFIWENNTENWKITNTLKPFSKYILKKYIENSHLDIYTTKQLRLIIKLKEKNKSIGTIDLFDFDFFHQRAGVGILIAEKTERGKNYSYLALEILKNYCFNFLKIHQLYCNISERNKISLNLFKKSNFKITARKKDWIKSSGNTWEDEFILQKIFFQIQNHKKI